MIEFVEDLRKAFELPLTDPIIAFSLILFIILLSPLLLKRLNIPGIIGLIIAGIAIGPHGFELLGPEMLEVGSAVDWFSTIGLLYIMFIAGLDLDLNQFKSNRNKSLLFGFFTFAIPLGVGFVALDYLLHFSFEASFLTASMFATHTLLTYPIVSKMGITKNEAVAVTVGGTILTDTMVLIILAVIIGKATGTLDAAFWIKLGISLTIFSLIMFLIIPRIAKWFFRKLESEKHSHYIFVLSIVFFSAFIAKAAGVEAIIGAFMAGLALNKLIPASSALMNRIEFMGNSLFIPFFLISVGMMVDISVIFHGWGAWMVAGTLTVVAVAGKWLASWITQIAFRYTKPQRQIIFGLSSAHAAATLAVIMVGYNTILDNGERLLDDSILNGTIILILVTSIIASLATERAAKKIKLDTKQEEKELKKGDEISKEHILLPVDDVDKMNKLLEFGVLIKDKESPHPISVLTVVSNNDEAELNILKAKTKLEDFVKEASASETDAKIATTIDYNVASGIARVSREIMADIIILGWPHHAGFFNKLIGSKMDSILNKTFKTTFICDLEKPLALHKKIVVFAPPLAEWEKGFSVWLEKVAKLSQELSIEIVMYANDTTYAAIQKYLTQNKIDATIHHKVFGEEDWEDFLIVSREVHKDDLLMLISARRGGTSHMGVFDSLPSKLERYFGENNYIVVYPQVVEKINIDAYQGDDLTNEPLSKGIEAVQWLGKEITSIFIKQEDKGDYYGDQGNDKEIEGED